MKQDPAGTSVESKTKYPHAPFPVVDDSPASADINSCSENRLPRWKILQILLHVVAALPISILVLLHQHKAVLISGLIAAFPSLFMWTVNKTVTRRTNHTESFWKKPYTVFLIGFIAIAIGVLLVEGFPTYQDTKRFYAAVESIQEQIDSGDKDAVQKLAYLYLYKESPIPHPYTHLTLDTKGAALLEEWLISKMQADEGDQYTEDMYNLAKSVAWYDKERANKWLSHAHRHGHDAAIQQLEELQSGDVDVKDRVLLAEREVELHSEEQLDKNTLSRRDVNDGAERSLRDNTENDSGKQHDNLDPVEPEELSMRSNHRALIESHQPPAQPNNTAASFRPEHKESLSTSGVRDSVFESYRIAPQRDTTDLQSGMTLMLSQSQAARWNANDAAQWYHKAAEDGDANAQSNLGWLYFKGEGISQNYEEAVKWYRKAAEQGDAAAQSNLGWMYETGKGVPRDNEKAVNWYRQAAEQGYAAAQSNLGAMYGNGKGVSHNDVLAYMWSDLAAIQGYPQGGENRRRIAFNMTRWQISEAQRLAREWMEARNK